MSMFHQNRIKKLLAVLLAAMLMCSGNAGVLVYAAEMTGIRPVMTVAEETEDVSLSGEIAESEAEDTPEAENTNEAMTAPEAEDEGASGSDTNAETDQGHKITEDIAVLVSEGLAAAYINEVSEPVATLDGAESYDFSAAIYVASDYSDTRVALAASGAKLQDWESDTDRFLKIDIVDLVQENGVEYRVVVSMQPSLYMADRSEVTGISQLYEANTPLSVNTDQKYLPGGSGTITYTLDSGTTLAMIPITLRYDNAIWNKLAGDSLKLDEDSPILRVQFQKVSGETTEVLEDLCLDDAFAGNARSNSTYVNLNSINEPDLSTAGSIAVLPDDKVRVSAGQMQNSGYSEGHYYKELLVQINLPKCTIDGETKYMGLDMSTLRFPVSGGTAEYVADTSQEGLVSITASNIYFAGNSLLSFQLTFPESIDDSESLTFTGGGLTISRDGSNLLQSSFSVTMETKKEAVLGYTVVPGNANTRHPQYVHRLGTFGLGNFEGKAESGPLRLDMEFDAGNTGKMHVTTIQLMPDLMSEYITVTYTLVDENGELYQDPNGNSIFSINVKNNWYQAEPNKYDMRVKFYRAMLPEAHRDYFFKTVSYEILSIPAGYRLWHSSASKSPNSGGTFWGYVDEGAEAGTLYTDVNVYDLTTDTLLGNLSSRDVVVSLDSGTDVSYGLANPTVSRTDTIQAGESVTIGGTISITPYPYTSNRLMSQAIVGVLLPEGISINEETVTLGGKKAEVEIKKIEPAVDGRYLWVVRFAKMDAIGYYSETLGAIAGGASVTFKMTLQTDVTVASHFLNMDEIVFATGYEANNSASGSAANYRVPEPQGYDLNRTGKVDYVAKFSSNATIDIQAAPALLNITDGVRKETGNSSSVSQLDHYADHVIYELNVACENGGRAEDFFYYIPIPHATTDGTDLTKASPVGLEMQGAATLTTTGTPMQILYTMDTELTYNNASAANWVSASEIGDGEWSNVTMLKIVLADGYDVLENGSTNIVSVPLYFEKKDSTGATVNEYQYAAYAGEKIVWNSKGYYHYQIGANVFAGNIPTSGATVTLTYTAWEEKEISLTAAKGGQHENRTVTLEVDVPFKNEQTYTLAVVTPKDVNLVGTASVIPAERANTDFGISVKINDSNSSDILTESVENEVGYAPANGKTVLTFTLFNGDALSDIVTERYVQIKLVGNNGVIIPVKINILREMALADNAASAIQGGKEYLQVAGDAETVEISEDSAFTAQFVVPNLIPDNYAVRTLSFSTPAAGTTIVMIDRTNPSAPGYYHYTLSAGEKEVVLTKFVRMGSGENYQYPTGVTPVTEQFLFVVDLPDNGAAAGDIGLTTSPRDGDEGVLATRLTYTTAARRSFELRVSDTGISPGEAFTLSYTTEVGSSNDSRYEGRQAALVFTGEGIPTDAALVFGENTYFLNANGQFVVPLGELRSGSATMVYRSGENTEVTMEAALWISANAAAASPLMGQKADAVSINIEAATEVSVKVTSMSPRVLTRDDLKSMVAFTYEMKNAGLYNAALVVQVKEGNGYRDINTVLNTVDGKPAESGVYSILNSGGTLSLKFAEQAAVGTYRIVLQLWRDTELILEVPYNFLVIEN